METNENYNDTTYYPIGGGILIGLGIGFFFLRTNPLIFVGCLLTGIGIGLIATAIISKNKK